MNRVQEHFLPLFTETTGMESTVSSIKKKTKKKTKQKNPMYGKDKWNNKSKHNGVE